MTTSSQLFTAVNKAAVASKHQLTGAPGTFSRTLNPGTSIISFSGSFNLTVAVTSNGVTLTPVPLFNTTGTENTDLFNAVFNSLTSPVNTATPNFRVTGGIASDGKGNLVFTYSGQLPYTDVESGDGLSTTRTVPAYFVADLPPTGGSTTPTTGGTTTSTTSGTTTTTARGLTFQSSTGGTTGSIAAATGVLISGTGLTPGAATFQFLVNGALYSSPSPITIPANGIYSLPSSAVNFSAGTWAARITDQSGAVTSNNFTVTT